MYSLDKIEVNINSIKQDKRTTHTTNQTPAYPKSVFFTRPCLCPCLPSSTPKVKPKTRASCFTLITLLSPSIRPTPPCPDFGFSTFCLHLSRSPSFHACCCLAHVGPCPLLSDFLPQPRNWCPYPLSVLHGEIKVIFQSHLSIQGDQSHLSKMFEMQNH